MALAPHVFLARVFDGGLPAPQAVTAGTCKAPVCTESDLSLCVLSERPTFFRHCLALCWVNAQAVARNPLTFGNLPEQSQPADASAHNH